MSEAILSVVGVLTGAGLGALVGWTITRMVDRHFERKASRADFRRVGAGEFAPIEAHVDGKKYISEYGHVWLNDDGTATNVFIGTAIAEEYGRREKRRRLLAKGLIGER